jgi:beta-galactosidase
MPRERYLLNRDWHFHLGEVENAIKTDHGVIYSTAKAGACQGIPQADYDVSQWQKVDLPHDWSIHTPFDKENVADWGYKSRGKGWYRRSFAVPEDAKDKKILLGFEGVSSRCTVYLNGTEIFHNTSGYTPFEMDITDIVYFGNVPNTLAVFVDASVWEGWWYEGAGIYRSVWIEMMHPLHIDRDSVFLNPKEQEDGSFFVEVEAIVENDTSNVKNGKLQCYLTAPDGEKVLVWETKKHSFAPDQNKITGKFIKKAPMLWDTENPNVYDVELFLLEEKDTKEAGAFETVDKIQTICGFRTVAFDAQKGFLLNHKPVKILGTCNHQDFGGIGVAVPSNLWEYRIEKLKAMGSNAYRCAHGMPADELIEACDRMGMLVLDENRNFSTSVEAIGQLETLVKRHRNHPSVILYSIFNEEPLEGTLQGMRMAKKMRRTILRLDPGRFVTGAMHGGMLEEENAAIAIDVAGVNYQLPIYDAFHEKNPAMPMIATETTSTFSIRGCYEKDDSKNLLASYDDSPADWGNTVRDTWKAIMERDFVAGGFMWTGFDYLGEPTPHVWPSVSSFFGLLDLCGFEKDGFYLAKAIFEKEPVCHVLPHWNHKGKEGSPIRVMSHTNCEEAELFVNGESLGRKNVDLFKQCEWIVPYQPGQIRLDGYRDGKVVSSDIQMTTGECKDIRLSSWKKNILENGEYAAVIIIEAIDASGLVVPDCNLMTEITVEGGKLLGSCNGDPNCHEPFDGKVRSIFHGKCMAVVRPDRGVNELKVMVRAELTEQRNGLFSDVQDHCEKPIDSFLKKSLILPVVSAKEAKELSTVQEMALTHWKLSPVSEERPDVLQKTESFDMNSWQDIYVNKESGSPKVLENAKGKYVIYQQEVQIPKEINGHLPELYLYGIWGECEVYINEEKRTEFAYEWAVPHTIKLEPKDCKRTDIRILVKSINDHGAGLNSTVTLR